MRIEGMRRTPRLRGLNRRNPAFTVGFSNCQSEAPAIPPPPPSSPAVAGCQWGFLRPHHHPGIARMYRRKLRLRVGLEGAVGGPELKGVGAGEGNRTLDT